MVLVVVLWFIWKARNAARFQNHPFEARSVIHEVDHFFYLFSHAKIVDGKWFV